MKAEAGEGSPRSGGPLDWVPAWLPAGLVVATVIASAAMAQAAIKDHDQRISKLEIGAQQAADAKAGDAVWKARMEDKFEHMSEAVDEIRNAVTGKGTRPARGAQ